MDQGFNQFIKNLSRDKSRELVGKLCKQIEVLQDQPNCSEVTKQTLGLQKALLKETIYQEFRDFCNALIFYSEGREYNKISIYNPTKENNS